MPRLSTNRQRPCVDKVYGECGRLLYYLLANVKHKPGHTAPAKALRIATSSAAQYGLGLMRLFGLFYRLACALVFVDAFEGQQPFPISCDGASLRRSLDFARPQQ